MTTNDKDKLLKQLVTAGIISDELLPDKDYKPMDSDELYDILSSAYELGYDEEQNVLYYIDSNGEKHEAPDLSAGMSTSSQWLCDVLPTPNIDIDQGGSVRRSCEIRSLYSLVCIGIVFKELRDEIREFIQNYNFIEYCSGNSDVSGYSSAALFLKSFTDLNSIQINCVVSASAINITQAQEKKDSFWRSNLTREETLELSKISRDIKGIILKYERDNSLNPNDINNLTKIEKLTAIQSRDIEIEKVINSSVYSTLYRITKLNSERLSPISKRRILNTSRNIAKLQVEKSGEVDKNRVLEIFDTTFYATQRSLTKKAVSTMIDKQIAKYKLDPKNYVFRKKI